MKMEPITKVVLCIICSLPAIPALAQSVNPVCSAEIIITNAKPIVSRSSVLNLNLFTTVSKPSGCLPAQISLSATYYDIEENVICSGTISGLIDQGGHIASSNLEIRPLNPLEFVRVLTPQRPAPKRLLCNNLEGNVEVGPTEMLKATSLALRATILPGYATVRTAEVRVMLNTQ